MILTPCQHIEGRRKRKPPEPAFIFYLLYVPGQGENPLPDQELSHEETLWKHRLLGRERHHHQSKVNSVLKKSAWKSKGSLLFKMLKGRDGDCRVRSLILCWGSIPHWFPIQAYKVLLTLLWPPSDLRQEAPVLHAERLPALTQGHLEWQKWGQLPWLWSHWTDVSISKSGLTWMILQESLWLLIDYNYNSDTSFKLGFNKIILLWRKGIWKTLSLAGLIMDIGSCDICICVTISLHFVCFWGGKSGSEWNLMVASSCGKSSTTLFFLSLASLSLLLFPRGASSTSAGLLSVNVAGISVMLSCGGTWSQL